MRQEALVNPDLLIWARESINMDLDGAAEEIAASEGQVSVATIKKTIDEHPEWEAKLDRAEFSDENLTSTLNGLRKFGFIRQEGDLP